MKKTLTLSLMVSTLSVFSQTFSVYVEQTFSPSTESLGLQYETKKGYGVFVSGGSNVTENLMVLNTTRNITGTPTNIGTTWWFRSPGDHSFVERPNTTLWTSPQSGNTLLDQTNFVSTYNSKDETKTTDYQRYNMGVIIPTKNPNIQFRVGTGILTKRIYGRTEHTKIVSSGTARLYYDNILNVNHITQNHSVDVDTWTTYQDSKTTTKSVNVGVQVQGTKTYLTLSADTKVGLHWGFGYKF
jgi:hypothetical protein